MVEPGVPRVCQFFLRGRCQRLKCEFRHPADKEKSVTDESSVLDQTVDATIVKPTVAKKKYLNIESAEAVPKDFAAYLNNSVEESSEESLLKSAPTSVIVAPKVPVLETPTTDLNGKPEEHTVQEETTAPVINPNTEPAEVVAPDGPISFQPTSDEPPNELLATDPEQATVTVADLIDEAEKKEEPPQEPPEVETAPDPVEPPAEEDMKSPVPDKSQVPDISQVEEKQTVEKQVIMEESPLTLNPKSKKTEAVKAAKAAELAQEWDDDMEDDDPIKEFPKEEEGKDEEVEETVQKSPPKPQLEDSVPEFTPRKSSRAPKPTEKKLESQQQENLKTEDMEESVDAIAKELEKPESEVKKSGKKDSKSPRKGKKGGNPGETKEDWVTLIFGENGEKVTDKGRKKGDSGKVEKSEVDIPEAEEFLMDQTPFQSKNKKGGRPRKKDLDEKMDGVAKLGSNMYFYTGPGGGQGGRDSPSSAHSDDEDGGSKKGKTESTRKSGRAGKGRNPRLEREDEEVDLPQAKAKEASLNPSWLKNHDGKSPAKKPQSVPITPVTTKTSTTVSNSKRKSAAVKEKEESVVSAAAEEIAAAMEMKEEEAKTPAKIEDMDAELPEFDPAKFTPGYVPKTVKKGDDEYMIVVQGVSDTGLCGKYWGDTTNLPSRRRSKAPETLQMGKTETPTASGSSRRGSVASVGSTDTTPTGRRTPQAKKTTPAPKETPKSNKKQVTKPEKVAVVAEPAESSQSESETETEVKKGRKRKAEAETPKEAKKEKKDQTVEEEQKATFSDYDSAGGAENTSPLRTTKRPSSKESPAKEKESKDSPLTSKQQTAVNAALAAGVPAGQQRSVSCVADTSTQREVVVECFAPYDDHRWVNIGKERDGMAPDAVQYARALRPPYHLLSFLRIKGHSTKGMSCTDKNTMVFVVLEGEITVILHTTQFNAKKGDSFYIPPKNYYNLINQKAREAELSLIQFQYDGPLPTVQPTPGS